MIAPEPAAVPEARGRPREAAMPPPFAFFKGALVGALIVVPAVAVTAFALSRLGFGDRWAPLIKFLRMAVLFAGLPTVFSSGGVGRLAARAAVDVRGGGVRRAMRRAAWTEAAVGAGAVLLTAIPMGRLPDDPHGWVALAVGGALAGACCGVIIGVFCGRTIASLPRLTGR